MSLESANDTPEEERFREALRALRDRGFTTDLALGSLLASVEGDDQYEMIAKEELAPRAGEMDLHLSGDEVLGHSANAAAFGGFVKQIAESVKVIARERMGRQRMVSDLLVEPGPGSVRVVFRTPDPVSPGAISAEATSTIWSDPNQQTLALQQVATLLANAEPGSPGADAVDGLVESLPPKARPKLVAAVNSIAREEWNVEGEFRQRGLGVQPIHVTRSGAARLKVALEVKERERAQWTAIGTFDGHRRARGICWFVEAATDREVTAIAPTNELREEIAYYAMDQARLAVVDFTVITTHGPGSGDSGTRSYIVEAVRPAVPPTELDGLVTGQ